MRQRLAALRELFVGECLRTTLVVALVWQFIQLSWSQYDVLITLHVPFERKFVHICMETSIVSKCMQHSKQSALLTAAVCLVYHAASGFSRPRTLSRALSVGLHLLPRLARSRSVFKGVTHRNLMSASYYGICNCRTLHREDKITCE